MIYFQNLIQVVVQVIKNMDRYYQYYRIFKNIPNNFFDCIHFLTADFRGSYRFSKYKKVKNFLDEEWFQIYSANNEPSMSD
jgi:hypothetical protein